MKSEPLLFSCEGQIDPLTSQIELHRIECNEQPEMERQLRRRLQTVRCWNISLKKVILLFLLIVTASVLAGFYGALHNQISYSVGAEYFTKIKFQQLGIADLVEQGLITPRLGAAFIGFVCTWWVGAIAAFILCTIGMIHSEQMIFRRTLRAFVYIFVTAVLFGLVGLGIGLFFPNPKNMSPNWHEPFDFPSRVS